MTLVPSPRLPLNGNKKYLLLLLLYVSSCSIARNSARSVNHETVKEEITVAEAQDASEKSASHKLHDKDEQLIHTEYQGKVFMVPPRKESYNLALILPFQLGFNSAIAKKRSALMYEYYSGALLAIEELETEGLKLNFHVFDNQNDTNKLKDLIASGKLDRMDLVVGPIQEDHMSLMASFAAQNKIPVFSPLTAVDSLPVKNQYFYNNIPGSVIKAKTLVNALQTQHPGEQLIIVRDNSRFDQNFTPILIRELKNSNHPYIIAEGSKWIEWSKYLKRDGLPVFIATDDQNTLSVISGKIIAHGKEAVVYGDQKWLTFTNNDYSFWEKLNVQVISSSGQYEEVDAVNQIRKRYVDKYAIPPAELALLGYDQFRFFGEALMAFGQHFASFIDDYNLHYAFTSYAFKLEGNCMQNDNARMYRFEEGKLQEVQP